jgi:hypothetical protein
MEKCEAPPNFAAFEEYNPKRMQKNTTGLIPSKIKKAEDHSVLGESKVKTA